MFEKTLVLIRSTYIIFFFWIEPPHPKLWPLSDPRGHCTIMKILYTITVSACCHINFTSPWQHCLTDPSIANFFYLIKHNAKTPPPPPNPSNLHPNSAWPPNNPMGMHFDLRINFNCLQRKFNRNKSITCIYISTIGNVCDHAYAYIQFFNNKFYCRPEFMIFG